MAEIFDFKTILKIYYKLFLEYLGIKEAAKIGFKLVWFTGVVLAGRVKVSFEVKNYINLLSPLGIWEKDQENPDMAIEAQFFWGRLRFFAVYMAIFLRNNYLNKLVDLYSLKLLKLQKK